MDSQRASSLRGLLLFLTGLSLGLFIWGIVGIIVGLAWLPSQQSAANIQFVAGISGTPDRGRADARLIGRG